MTTSDLESAPRRNPLVGLVEGVGNGVLEVIRTVGGLVALGASVVVWSVRPPYRVQNLFAQFDFVGVGSILLVGLTGTFSGMVFATQSWSAFELFGAESLVGPTVALTVTRELAPVFSALMVTMRACSAMCTELGTMRVTEQVDALETMAVNPVQYLLVPRVLAGLAMVPLLTMIFDTAGLFGGFFVAVPLKGLSVGTFVLRTQNLLTPDDIWEGLSKGAVFGFTVALIACYRGYNAHGGAKGVGRATTRAMVDAAVAVFIEDYFMGLLFHG
jgi:phospholipid/cholesterol/gamma-HCH transport system permease protein